MKRKELVDNIAITIREYIGISYDYNRNLKLKINPVSLSVSVISESEMLDNIEDSNEAVEDAAAAERAAAQEAADFQVSQNPDFYDISDLVKLSSGGLTELDYDAINAIAGKYCPD